MGEGNGGGYGGGGRGGVLISCIDVVLRPLTLVSLQSRDKACRLVTNQADIACTKHDGTARCSASRMEEELNPTKSHSGGEGGCIQFVHGRSRMTIDPRIPTMPGRSTSGFHHPGRHCLRQARSAVGCSASCMKGELRLSKNRS